MRISPLARFVLAGCLFAAWIGWLSWMASKKNEQTVLSRPQLLISEMDVVAEVPALDQPVVIETVLRNTIKDSAVKPGDSIKVDNLADCKRLMREGEEARDVPLDWTGSG